MPETMTAQRQAVGTAPRLTIGDAARASGVTPKMIRHYEKIGLLPATARTAAGYRLYSEQDVHALRFIKRARGLGFSLDQTAWLLALWRDRSRSSADVKQVVLAHVEELERRIAEFQAMAATLRHLAEHCHGDAQPDCPILDELGAGT